MNRKHSLAFLLFAAIVIPQLLFGDETKSWTDKIKLSGDFRYRYEFISSQTLNSSGAKTRNYDRNRNRIRARLGLQALINTDMDAYFRLASSTGTSNTNNPIGGDPVSTNQDLSGGSTPKPIWIDRAYLDYHPQALKWLDARAGRQPVPFETNNDQLIWDNDLNLEGVSALLNHKHGDIELFLRGGGYWAGERAPIGFTRHALDQGVFTGQLGGKLSVDNIKAQLAVAYVDFGNVKNNPTIYAPNNGFGNTLVAINRRNGADTLDTKGYKFDYNIINVNGAASVKLDKIEPGIFFDFATNGDVKAGTDSAYVASYGTKKLNTAWLVGAAAKFKGLPFDWDLSYDYRYVGKDAVLGAWTYSDPAGGGTNYNGHQLALGFNVLPNSRLAFTYMKNIKDPDNKNSLTHLGYDRIQADVEVKF